MREVNGILSSVYLGIGGYLYVVAGARNRATNTAAALSSSR
jgi:hypothetical protein